MTFASGELFSSVGEFPWSCESGGVESNHANTLTGLVFFCVIQNRLYRVVKRQTPLDAQRVYARQRRRVEHGVGV